MAQDRAHRGDLGRSQEHIGAVPEAIGKVAGRGRDHRGLGLHPRLIAHAQRAARHFRARAGLAEDAVIAFLGELMPVHPGRRRDPEPGRDGLGRFLQHLAGRAKMADIGHAGADEDLVDPGPGHLGQGLDIVRVVRAGQQRFLDLIQIDLEDPRVFGIRIGFHQYGIGQPGLHLRGPAFERAGVVIALVYHPAQQGHVGLQVFDNGFFAEADRAAAGRALGAGIGELKGLFAFEIGQPLDLKDAARKYILLALLGHGQIARLERGIGDRVDQIPQGDAGLQLALEAHQHRFRHIQRHDPGGGRERDQPGTRREGDAERETGMRIRARADRVRQQHAVQPGMNNAIARAQGDAAAGLDKVRQGVVGVDIHGLRIGRRMTERLHHQIGRETQAGQVFQFVPRHRAGGVLRTHGGHPGLAIGPRADARHARGPAHYLLRQGKAPAAVAGGGRLAEQGVGAEAERLARARGQAAADDQRDPAAGLDFIKDDLGL